MSVSYLRNGAVNIIMRAVHESVEHKLNFLKTLKSLLQLPFTPIKIALSIVRVLNRVTVLSR